MIHHADPFCRLERELNPQKEGVFRTTMCGVVLLNKMSTGTQPENSGIELETVIQEIQSATIRKGFCHLPVTLCVSSASERVIRLESERVFSYLIVILSIFWEDH